MKIKDYFSAKVSPILLFTRSDGKEVAVVYYRTGYSPEEYNGDRDWQVRLDIERSKAIKCPSVHYHLAGTKKVR